MIYKIKKGLSRWTPSYFKLLFRFNKLTWITTPHSSMRFHYRYEEGLDKDWHDWKKIGGISFVNWKNLRNIFIKNRDSIILAWRYNPELEIFEYCIYENKNGSNIPYERPDQILRVKLEDNASVFLEVEPVNKTTYTCYLYSTMEEKKKVNPILITTRNKFTFFSYINMWYGGANNSAGPYGGKAPKDMECEATFFLT